MHDCVVLDLMDLTGPIGGPAFSSQTLIGGLWRTTICLSKTSHSGFPTIFKLRQLHILQRAAIYSLVCEFKMVTVFMKSSQINVSFNL